MTRRMIAPAFGLVALASAQGAQAQNQACVAPADMSDAVVYAMPIAFDAARNACANRLTQRGFMATRGDAYIAPFRASQDKSWPGAFRMLKTFMAQKDGANEEGAIDMTAMLQSMPDAALRPFVDALIGQMIAQEIKGDICAKIERGLELLSPLPTDNVGGLAAFLVEMSDVKNPPVCTTAQTASGK